MLLCRPCLNLANGIQGAAAGGVTSAALDMVEDAQDALAGW